MNKELIAKAMTRSFVRMSYLLLDSFYSMILPIRDHKQERCVLVPRQTKDNLVLSDLLVTRLNRGPQRPTHSFLKLRAYSLNVLPPGFRFLYGDHPADPFIARERRNVFPFFPRR